MDKRKDEYLPRQQEEERVDISAGANQNGANKRRNRHHTENKRDGKQGLFFTESDSRRDTEIYETGDDSDEDFEKYEKPRDNVKWWLNRIGKLLTWKKFRTKSDVRRKKALKRAASISNDVREDGKISLWRLFMFKDPILEDIYQVHYRGEQGASKIWIGLYCLFLFGFTYLFFFENVDDGASQEIIMSIWVLRVTFLIAIIATFYITRSKDGCKKGDKCMPKTYHWLRACASTILGFFIIWRCVLEPNDTVYFRLVGIWSIGWQAVVFMYASLHFFEFLFFNLLYSLYYLAVHHFIRHMGPDTPQLWMGTVFVFFFFITLLSEVNDRLGFIEGVRVYQQIAENEQQRLRAEAEEQKAVQAVNDKRQFISYIFHELRVPLSAVRMGIDAAVFILQGLRDRAEKAPKNEHGSSEKGGSKWTGRLTVNTNMDRFGRQSNAPRFAALLASESKGDEHLRLNADVNDPQSCIIPGRGMVVSFDDLENLDETLDTMKNSMEQAMRILDDVLSINKVEAGKFKLFPGYFRISTLVDEEFTKHSNVADGCGISMQKDVEDRDEFSMLVIGDYVRLCQVFDNFLSNALKFTNKGGTVIAGATLLDKYELPTKTLEKKVSIGPELAPAPGKRTSLGEAIHRDTQSTGGTTSRRQLPSQMGFQSRMAWKINQLLEGNSIPDDGDTDSADPLENYGADEATAFEFYDSIESVDDNPEGPSNDGFVVHSPERRAPLDTMDTSECLVGDEERESKQQNPVLRRSSSSSDSQGSWENEDTESPVRMGKIVLYVRLWVKDTGCGLSEDDRKLVFNAYQQTGAGTKKEHSTGLGLSIAQHITRLHGGTIGVHSEGVDKGSTFYMDIPFRVASKSAAKHLETPSSSFYHLKTQSFNDDQSDDMSRRFKDHRRGESKRTGNSRAINNTAVDEPTTGGYPGSSDVNRTALIVDDSSGNARMLKLLLSQRGYTCDIVSDGIPAVDYIRNRIHNKEELPFVVFMDYSMPRMSGPEAVKEIRKLGYEGAVIGITGNANQEDQKTFRDAGTDSILWKPINAKMLEDAIRQVFDTRR
eukprot:gb/GECG01003141.1/.p1 GENE.gb/GECG01003141.1/~~gb/GECG01003141.1/.p1  ORF type:complete len:1053 (+),score=138.01 gb/GECG01003141.1/:1-3159(+)